MEYIRSHSPRFIEDLLFLDNKLTYTKESKMPSYITHITAAQRLDSRGNPTVQVTLTTDKGFPSPFCFDESVLG
jgi:hypothetical protein